MDGILKLSESWMASAEFIWSFTSRGGLVLGLILVASWIGLRRSSAATHDFLCRCTVAALLMLPLLWFVPRFPELLTVPVSMAMPIVSEGHQEGGGLESSLQEMVPSTAQHEAAVPAAGTAEEAKPERAHWLKEWSGTIVVGWLIGSVVVVGPCLIGLCRVERLVRKCARVEHPGWRADVDEIARRLGIRRPIAMLTGAGVEVPFVGGLLRSWLVLPEAVLNLPGEERRTVLRHELTHVRRGDTAIRVLARVALALHWVNPLVWIYHTRLLAAEEQAVDEAVLADGSVHPLRYAELLARLASAGAVASAVSPSMAHPSALAKRIGRILHAGCRRRQLSRAGRISLAGGIAMLTLLTHGVVGDDRGQAGGESNESLQANDDAQLVTRHIRLSRKEWTRHSEKYQTAEQYLAANGINFRDGSAAIYDGESMQLAVSLPMAEMERLMEFLTGQFGLSHVMIGRRQIVLPVGFGENLPADALIDPLLDAAARKAKVTHVVAVWTLPMFTEALRSLERGGATVRVFPSVVTWSRQEVDSFMIEDDEELPFRRMKIRADVAADNYTIDLTLDLDRVEHGVTLWDGIAVVLCFPAADSGDYVWEIVQVRLVDAHGAPLRPDASLAPANE